MLIDLLNEVDVVSGEFLYLGGVAKRGLNLMHVVNEFALVLGGHGNDVVHAEVAENAGFNLNLLLISFPLNLVAGFELVFLHDVHVLEHLDGLCVEVTVEDNRARSFAVEAAALCLFLPFVAIAIAIEVDGLANLDVLTYNFEDGADFAFTLGDERVYAGLEVGQGFGYGRVEDNHCAGAVGD